MHLHASARLGAGRFASVRAIEDGLSSRAAAAAFTSRTARGSPDERPSKPPGAAVSVIAMRAIAYVVGARPNFVKMAPVQLALRALLPATRHVTLHTEQHYDRGLSEIFFEELGLPAPDHALGVGSGSHGRQTALALERIEEALMRERPDLVIAAGDVNSTLAAGLAAVKLGIPVAHLEAGLRSFDRTMPEEINRLLVDQISDHCLIHSPEARENLLREGIGEERIAFVGNTMIDTLVRMRPRAERSRIHEQLGVERGNYLLVTLHRPALVDGPLLEEVLDRLAALSRLCPVIFPLHPRTRRQLRHEPAGLQLVDPVGYVDFLALEAHAKGVVTDSGGVQEETTFLGVPCFTLRDNTERPVTVTQGTNTLLGLRPEALDEVPELLVRAVRPLRPPQGWDGRAAERVAGVLAGEVPAVAQAVARA
jgi:UDP-N-acetylglucosamine 2-epimerase (non-hydrolysing)